MTTLWPAVLATPGEGTKGDLLKTLVSWSPSTGNLGPTANKVRDSVPRDCSGDVNRSPVCFKHQGVRDHRFQPSIWQVRPRAIGTCNSDGEGATTCVTSGV